MQDYDNSRRKKRTMQISWLCPKSLCHFANSLSHWNFLWPPCLSLWLRLLRTANPTRQWHRFGLVCYTPIDLFIVERELFIWHHPPWIYRKIKYSWRSQICCARRGFSSCSQKELVNVFLIPYWNAKWNKKIQLKFYLLKKGKISVKQIIYWNANLVSKKEMFCFPP